MLNSRDYVSVVYLFYAFLSFFIKFAIAILTGKQTT